MFKAFVLALLAVSAVISTTELAAKSTVYPDQRGSISNV